jgi:hypothetical protein
MTYLEMRIAARDSLAAEIMGEQARRAALVAAGNPPPMNYSSGGKSAQPTDWLEKANASLKAMNEEIVALSATYEFVTRGYSG